MRSGNVTWSLSQTLMKRYVNATIRFFLSVAKSIRYFLVEANTEFCVIIKMIYFASFVTKEGLFIWLVLNSLVVCQNQKGSLLETHDIGLAKLTRTVSNV